MADISMCEGTECPWKTKCYRFMAKPNPYRQSYFADVPGKMIDEVFTCDYFWALEETKQNIKDIFRESF